MFCDYSAPFVMLTVFALNPPEERVAKEGMVDPSQDIVSQMRDIFNSGAPIIDLMTTIFALAEVGIDETSTELLAKHRELGFFEKESLAKLVLDQMNAFRQVLPKTQVPWQVAIIKVHVHVDTDPTRNLNKKMRYERFCVLKGDLTAKYRGQDTGIHRDASRINTSNGREGVLILWVEERPDQIQKQQSGKETGSKAPRSTSPKVSASISLTLIAFNKGEFHERTKLIRVRHKGEQRWESVGH